MSNPHLPITITSTLTILLLLVSFSLTTYTLTTYLHLAHTATSLVPKAIVHDTAILATTSYHIFTTILTSATFITIFFLFPRITKSKGGNPSWIQKGLTCLATLLLTTSLLAFTIILATRKMSFGDVGPHVTVYLDEGLGEKQLVYRDDGRAVVGVVLGWVGWIGASVLCGMMMLGGKKEVGRGEMWVDKVEVEQESRAESV
ncbi:hypothetical protein CBS115989_3933 [Aspergillus niger]|uniref:MARVEL domain-containing protein n=1 Tax=Aspergillus niger ATCC 13496 TaxID=1353008 RepID=A0A370C2D7_ASPNG|nr:hypothetical protein ANI_1_2062094 [Aspergillus niger CBS 513.88]XP_025455019.1 uncharacterized protein BO96DRAFT_500113 [Aspergillus niger CBS 101883]KAI2820024.1 hypothetical protein CBS115989_3933 [Aspergillus niger]RDH21209.1 hypothetical protein M747DRAFT_304629 [Aspergillus niger ATCC 13496]KAI2833386.1 hypothetical protein CBS133816_751 [Aspergillus niger]KAI2848383.1 hypothetical protein CBS11350_2796 [Aspergillus niger]KAI2856390.1 hypothetical protein CBS11232_3741 [Aspergillus n|eukprot:XP_003188843.1 hypothetical protein ANI_1_2062094 [Aspergillus niger CBS 513.88]